MPHLQLEDGAAEVFGAELQKGNAVDVTGQKLAVFTWTGAKIVVNGKPTMM
jgi:polyribonucleotide 5'-hydroxyl-kinase